MKLGSGNRWWVFLFFHFHNIFTSSKTKDLGWIKHQYGANLCKLSFFFHSAQLCLVAGLNRCWSTSIMNVGCENCASVCGDRWALTVLIFQTCIPSLLSPQGSLQPRSALKGRVHHGKRVCASLSLLWDQHDIRRIRLTLVKSPGITYHYLFLLQRKPKACSNCIINIIAVWGPIINLSFTCPNLEWGNAVCVK